MESDDERLMQHDNGEKPETASINFLDIIIAQGVVLCKVSSDNIRRFLDNLQVTEIVDAAGDKLAEHPVLGFTLLAMALSCGLPIVVFIIFAIISVIFTFAGFIFVEGTILAVGCFFLFGCLLTMILVMSMMAVLLTCIYFTVVRIGNIVNNSERTKTFINHIVPFLTGAEDIQYQPPSSVQDAHQD